MVSLVTLDVGGSGAGDALSMVVGGGGGGGAGLLYHLSGCLLREG